MGPWAGSQRAGNWDPRPATSSLPDGAGHAPLWASFPLICHKGGGAGGGRHIAEVQGTALSPVVSLN